MSTIVNPRLMCAAKPPSFFGVFAIIAMLISILLPALGEARNTAQPVN